MRDSATDTVTLSGAYSWGTAAPWDFNQNDAAVVTINNASFSGMGDFTLGTSVSGGAVFSLASGSSVISNGANIDGSTVNGDLEINDDRDYSNLVINGDVRVNTGTNSIVNYSNVVWTGDLINTGTGTLTINTSNGTSGTTSEAGTGAGQVNLLSTATFTVSGLINNCEIRIYDNELPNPNAYDTELTGAEVNVGTTFVYVHSGTTNEIVVQMMAAGYIEIKTIFTLNSSDQTLTLTPEIDTNI